MAYQWHTGIPFASQFAHSIDGSQRSPTIDSTSKIIQVLYLVLFAVLASFSFYSAITTPWGGASLPVVALRWPLSRVGLSVRVVLPMACQWPSPSFWGDCLQKLPQRYADGITTPRAFQAMAINVCHNLTSKSSIPTASLVEGLFFNQKRVRLVHGRQAGTSRRQMFAHRTFCSPRLSARLEAEESQNVIGTAWHSQLSIGPWSRRMS